LEGQIYPFWILGRQVDERITSAMEGDRGQSSGKNLRYPAKKHVGWYMMGK
jgi:hypothetical protein